MILKLKNRLLRYLALSLKRAELQLAEETVNQRKKLFQCCGWGVRIHPSVEIVDAKGLAVGNNVHIGADCFIHAEGGVQIRNNAHISRRVTIYGSDHDFRADPILPYGPKRRWKQVVIGCNVWIGMNACILPGVTIGEGAIIGMGAVVARDVAPNEIVGQAGQRVLGMRDRHDCPTAEAVGGRNGRLLSADDLAAYYPTARERMPKMVFVLSTGRSGSTTIAEWLDGHPDIDARHEPRRQLIQWSTEFDHGEVEESELRQRMDDLFLDGTVYRSASVRLESDQKLYNLVPILREMLPDAHFIWLLRSAPDVVASAVGRGWYSDVAETFQTLQNPWFREHWRIKGDRLGEPVAGFSGFSQFEKCAWYWAYVNKKIETALADVPDAQKLTVRIEDMSEKAADILRFCGVSSFGGGIPVANKARHERHMRERWNDNEQAAFKRWCVPMMARYYPDVD